MGSTIHLGTSNGLKTNLDGFYRVGSSHLDNYVTEFAGRHDARETDMLDQMGNLVRGMVGRRLHYDDLIS